MGDAFLKSIFDTVKKMKEQARVNNKSPPYLYEYYNVTGFWKQNSRRVIRHTLNAFIEALNGGHCLPRFLVIVLDKDLIEDVDLYDFGASKEIYENLKWLIKQMDVLIKQKKTEIAAIKPGVLYSTDPKVILVMMLRCPLFFPVGSQMEKVSSLRAKFNNALNDIAYEMEHSIMSIDACNEEKHFDLLGCLNHYGQFTFWKQFHFLLQEFDKKKVELTPIRCRSVSTHHNGSGDHSFHK